MKLLSKPDYEAYLASTRDARMSWWRDAHFGMFVHYGIYSSLGRHEWCQAMECIPKEEYEQFANNFCPKPGAPREWARLAKAAGMKYMVLTTRHHEGFSLWDSKVNPFNSVNYGPHRDIVREYVDACREFGLKIGFYSSLMDWHHPDGYACAYDNEARRRFLDYIEALNTELLTNYGKIDILWYDVSCPMQGWEGWDSLERNQRLRALQPDIIINDRSCLPEDFGTPEGSVTASERDWEACMTFNGFSWGYIDSEQAKAYSYTPQRILDTLYKAVSKGGNLLLNIGPAPDGSVPAEAVEPLTKVGEWLQVHGDAVYGKRTRVNQWGEIGNGICSSTADADGLTYYVWNWIWPRGGTMNLGSPIAPKKITLMETGEEVDFEHKGSRIILKNLAEKSPDKTCGIAVFKVEFDEKPQYTWCAYLPQLHGGQDPVNGNRL